MFLCFFFSNRRRHTRWNCDWSSDVCSSDLDRPRRLHAERRAALPLYSNVVIMVRFDKDRVGLCEIAFRAESRAQVDAVAKGLANVGARVLDPPREYPYRPGYYAVFFADPDGIKLELVYIPEE